MNTRFYFKLQAVWCLIQFLSSLKEIFTITKSFECFFWKRRLILFLAVSRLYLEFMWIYLNEFEFMWELLCDTEFDFILFYFFLSNIHELINEWTFLRNHEINVFLILWILFWIYQRSCREIIFWEPSSSFRESFKILKQFQEMCWIGF